MSDNWNYVSGDWNIICDVCSIKTKASKTRKRWDGFQVCPNCWEERQPLDFVRARQDKISVPFARPEPPDIFTDVVYICTVEGRSAMAGMAVAGCSICGTTENAPVYPDYNAIANLAITGVAITGVSTFL